MAEPPAIFISYRRSDAGGYAWALRDYLTTRFDPDTLFFDREKIDAGAVFPDRLRAAVEGCQVLLAVIAPDWLEATDGNGHRRLDDEVDWVRSEIALALARGKTVVPVLFGDDTQPPPADRLPVPLQLLASLQVRRLRGDFSEYDAQRQDLVRVLGQVEGVPQPRADQTQPVIGIPVDQVASLIAAANEPLVKLTAQQHDTIRELERKTGVGEGALRTFFRTLGEQEVPPERYAEKLAEIAERYRNLVAEIAAMPAEEPEIARLKAAADVALQAGDLDRASDLHVEMLALQDQAADRAMQEAERKRLDAAATAARLGEIALTGLRYLEAARYFAAAASRVPAGYEDERLQYLDAEADALLRQGEEKGDNNALRTAIERYEALLLRRPRARVPIEWAKRQNNLGVALWRLGERENDPVRLKEAVVAFLAALEESKRELVPLDWATAQHNLGLVLKTLGERENDTARLKDAVSALQSVLEEWDRERVPLAWATAQNNLGNVLTALGNRESGTTRLQEAVAAFRLALEVRTRDRVPLDWAKTQNSLGYALWSLAEREGGTARLHKAVSACRAALEELSRERIPLEWASALNNLGVALAMLGERENRMALLKEAVAAFRLALQERNRERVPLLWAMTQDNLGNALLRLGERNNDIERLEEAVVAYGLALEERTREYVPLDWAMTQNNLGNALWRLGERESGTARLEAAVMAYRAALQERTRERVPLQWAGTQNNLGNALWRLGERESGTARLEAAVMAYRAALQERTRERVPLQWAGTQNNLGNALQMLGERTQNAATLREARAAVAAAFEVFIQAGQQHRRAYFESRLRQLDEEIAKLAKPKR